MECVVTKGQRGGVGDDEGSMGLGVFADPPGKPIERDVDAHRIKTSITPLPDRVPIAAADIEQTLTGMASIAEEPGQKRHSFGSGASFESFGFSEEIV